MSNLQNLKEIKILVVWYSETGNTWLCANRAQEKLKNFNESKINVSFKSVHDAINDNDDNLQEIDILLLAFPVFNFCPPVPILNYILKLKERMKQRRELGLLEENKLFKKGVYAIITMGGAAANTAWILSKKLSEISAKLVDHLLLTCEDSYIPLRKWFSLFAKKGLPNDHTLTLVDKFIEQKVLSRVQFNKIKPARIFFNPFNLFHWISRFSTPNAPKKLLGKKRWDYTKCSACSLCIKACPSAAITEGDHYFSDVNKDKYLSYKDELCIGCCGCLNLCPVHAWSCSFFPSKYYYRPSHYSIFTKYLLRK